MKTVTEYVTCDECHATGADELRFAVLGKDYAIDLCVTHRAVFDTLIQPYISNGHAVRFNHHVVRRDRPKATKTPVEKATDNRKRQRARRAKATDQTATEGTE